jgi:hypothetical protein
MTAGIPARYPKLEYSDSLGWTEHVQIEQLRREPEW